MSEEGSNEKTVSAERARELIATSKAQVLDLRSDEQWEKVGNIPNSVRAPDGDAAEAAKQIDDDKQVIVLCADGSESAEVAEKLRDDGRDAVSIEGGMESWEDDDLPLQPTDDPDLPGEGDESEDDGDGSEDAPDDAPAADADSSGDSASRS